MYPFWATGHSDGAVVRALHCKPPGSGFKYDSYLCLMAVSPRELPFGQMSRLWPWSSLNSRNQLHSFRAAENLKTRSKKLMLDVHSALLASTLWCFQVRRLYILTKPNSHTFIWAVVTYMANTHGVRAMRLETELAPCVGRWDVIT